MKYKNTPGQSIEEYTLWLARQRLKPDVTTKEADNFMLSFGFEKDARII